MRDNLNPPEKISGGNSRIRAGVDDFIENGHRVKLPGDLDEAPLRRAQHSFEPAAGRVPACDGRAKPRVYGPTEGA